MKLTKSLILETLDKGYGIISDVWPTFTRPRIGFYDIKIGQSRTNWATIFIHSNDDFQPFRLIVSDIFERIPDENIAQRALLETLIHEAIHTIPGCANHQQKFKRVCALVNAANPSLKITVTSNFKNYGIKDFSKREVKVTETWDIKCTDCGKTWHYKWKPDWATKNRIGRCTCPYCKTHHIVAIKIKL